MPVAEFPGRRNWGYDGVALYAPQSGYGGPEGLRRLVDAAHRARPRRPARRGLQPPRPGGELPPRVRPLLHRPVPHALGRRPSTSTGPTATRSAATWWTTRVYWIEEFHLDGLRLDAADTDRRRSEPDSPGRGDRRRRASPGEALGRPTVVIAESDINDPRCGAARRDGRLRARRAVVATTSTTPCTRRSPASGAGTTPTSAAWVRSRACCAGATSTTAAIRPIRAGATAHPRGRRARRPVRRLRAEPRSGRQPRRAASAWRRWSSRRGVRLAAAVLLLAPYVPLLFMGEEYGETQSVPVLREPRRSRPDRGGPRGAPPGVRRLRLARRDPRSAVPRRPSPRSRLGWDRASRRDRTRRCSRSTAVCCGSAARSRRCGPARATRGRGTTSGDGAWRGAATVRRTRLGAGARSSTSPIAHVIVAAGPAHAAELLARHRRPALTAATAATPARPGTAPAPAGPHRPRSVAEPAHDADLARGALPARRHVGRRGHRTSRSSPSTRPAVELCLFDAPDDADETASASTLQRAHRPDLARLPARRAARPALRLSRARPVRARARAIASTRTSCCSTLRQGHQRATIRWSDALLG